MFFTFYILGEFGSVFKAHLKWHRSAETNVVAVKTMKGTSYTSQVRQDSNYMHRSLCLGCRIPCNVIPLRISIVSPSEAAFNRIAELPLWAGLMRGAHARFICL